MGRLKALPSRLSALPPRLGAGMQGNRREQSARRDASSPWRAWYKTARWQKLRWSVLTEALFTCAKCGRTDHDTSKLVADHKRAHRGDERLFWDRSNLQCLCKRCHDSDKQREERAAR